MSAFLSTFTEVGLVNTQTNAGTITLPLTSQIPFRQIILKDSYGNFSNKTLTISTQTGESFEDGKTTRTLRDSFGFQTLYGVSGTWYFLGGSAQNATTASTLTVSTINGFVPGAVTNANYISTFTLSSGSITTSSLQVLTLSTGFLTVPYLSTIGISTGYLNASSINTLAFNVSTTGTISSLTVNSLQFGDGTGWVNIGPLQAVAVSSIQENTNALYVNNPYIGNLSSLNSLQFYGPFGNYNNTVLAEVSTGAGIQEFLVFRGSSSSDRIRFQTTGNFVIETGVSARLFSNTTLPTLSNATPAFVINTSSNVGIQTASPGATLDVAGTARAITLSSQQLFTSSINGGLPFLTANAVSTVQGLGSVNYVSTLSLVSTTLGLQMSGYLSTPTLTSTTAGLGTFGYISSLSLNSTVQGLATYGYISSLSLQSTVRGLGTAGYISTLSLNSTIQGLGTYAYLSSLSSVTYISAVQIIASSIYATVAGPTTVVLYEM